MRGNDRQLMISVIDTGGLQWSPGIFLTAEEDPSVRRPYDVRLRPVIESNGVTPDSRISYAL